MKIAVLAANGRSGKAFVEAALAAGHEIRAGYHRQKLDTQHPNLTQIACDATNATQITELIAGSDAVVSFIGHVKGSPARVQTEAMRVVIAAMKAAGIARIVSLTGTGVRFPRDHVGPVDWFLNLSISLIDPERIADGKEHVAALQASDLEWTILRVLKLQNTKPRPFALTPNGPTLWYVSRESVAAAALEVLEDHSFVREAPILSKI